MTPFSKIYNRFLGKITDDLYLELTEEDTIRDCKQILLDAIPYFEFPRFSIWSFDEEAEIFEANLTDEEINIFAILMKLVWLERQISSIENIRMKYSSADFKMTSQANHLSKLLSLKNENVRESTHAQRLYKRRRPTTAHGVESNWDIFNSGVYYGDTEQSSGASSETVESGSVWEPVTSSNTGTTNTGDYDWSQV